SHCEATLRRSRSISHSLFKGTAKWVCKPSASFPGPPRRSFSDRCGCRRRRIGGIAIGAKEDHFGFKMDRVCSLFVGGADIDHGVPAVAINGLVAAPSR